MNNKDMKQLTLEEFNKILPGEEIGTGVLPNSPEGLFMTRAGGELRWVAVKGYGNDWAIYCHWSKFNEEYVRNSGDKLISKENILKCVPCSDEVLDLYLY